MSSEMEKSKSKNQTSNQLNTKHAHAKQSLGLLLWQVSSLWQRQQREALSKCGLTHAQFVYLATLAWISNSEDLITQSRLIQMNKMDKMMMSDLTKTLSNKKMIKVKKHPQDNRASVIEITQAGLSLVNKAIPLVENVDEVFFELNKNESSDFLNLLTKLNQINSSSSR